MLSGDLAGWDGGGGMGGRLNREEMCVCVCVCVYTLSHVRLSAAPWTVACQVPLSKGFSRQEYWRGLPFPPPGDLPNSGIELECLVFPASADEFFTTSITWEAQIYVYT